MLESLGWLGVRKFDLGLMALLAWAMNDLIELSLALSPEIAHQKSA